MPRKKPPEPEEKPQSERFKDAAREHGADESGEAFERALRHVVKPPKSQ